MKPTETELPTIADADLDQATGGSLWQTFQSWFSSGSNPPPSGPTQPTQPCPYTDGRRHSRTLCPRQ